MDIRVSIDKYRNEIRELLTEEGVDKNRVNIILEKEKEILKSWKEGLSVKECIKKIFNIK